MAAKPVSEHVLDEAVSALRDCGGSVSRAALQLGIPRTTLNARLEVAKRSGMITGGAVSLSPGGDRKTEPKFEFVESNQSATIWSIGTAVRTVADAIAKAEIDLREWEVIEKTVNSWPTTMKLASGSKLDGTYEEKPQTEYNWQVKLKLRRKAPKAIQLSVKELLADFKPSKLPSVVRRKHRHMHLLEISLYDAHFGKLCWSPETGENYDLEIAETDYCRAVDDLLASVVGFDVEKIIFPIGHDFFQANNWLGTTAGGTVVDSVDDRMQKVFRIGCKAVEYAILRAREVADVECIWVPGNHDPETSWYLCEVIEAMFRNDKHVTVDAGPKSRKYRRYGVTLLGYTHGDTSKQPKLKDLPLIMATDPECRLDFAETNYQAWRVGHFHHKQQFERIGSDSFNGVRVDVMPSLSGTDKWHYEKGFVHNPRVAEAWLWSKTHGYRGQFSVASLSQKEAFSKHTRAAAARRKARSV